MKTAHILFASTLLGAAFTTAFAAPKAAAKPAAPAAKPIDPAAQKEADTTFATVCSTCHGTVGQGDGPASASLNPKPAKFADPEFQKTRTDEHLTKVILEGGPAVGKSPLMPPNPQFKDKPEVIRALVSKVRGFGAKK